jgi:tetratricopeptide (TPR) repeat protein
LQFEQGKADEAVKTGEAALAACPPIEELKSPVAVMNRQKILFSLATVAVENNKVAAAEPRMSQLRALNPKDSRVAFLEGRIAFQKQDYNTAYKKFKAAADEQAHLAGLTMQDVRRHRLQQREATYRFHLGQVYEIRNLLGLAEKEYRKALALRGGLNVKADVPIRFRLMLVLDNAGKFNEATAEARTLLRSFPDSFTVLRVLAGSLTQSDRVAEALPYALKSIEIEPARYEGYVNLSEAYRRLERAAEQEKALLDGLDKADAKYMLYLRLIAVYHSQGLKDKVDALRARAQDDESLTEDQKLQFEISAAGSAKERLATAEREVQKDPENPRKMAAVAQLLVQNAQNEEAVVWYKRAYDAAAKKADRGLMGTIWDRAWLLLLRTGKRDDAHQWIDQLPEDMIRERRVARGLMELLDADQLPEDESKGVPPYKLKAIRLRHVRSAIAIFNKLREEGEGSLPNTQILRALAQAHLRLAGLDDAERTNGLIQAAQLLTRVVELLPQDLQGRLDLSNVYLQQLEPRKARLHVGYVLSRRPNSIAAMRIQTKAQEMLKEYPKAIETRLQIRRLNSGDAANLMGLGVLHQYLGQRAKALEAFDAARQIAPKAPNVILPYVRLLYSGGSADEMKQADAAMEAFVAAGGNTAASHINHAQYLWDTGRPKQALEAAKRATDEDPDSSAPVLFYSRLLLKGQPPQYADAARLCRDYLAEHPDALDVKIQLCDILTLNEETLDEAVTEMESLPPEIRNTVKAQTVLARTHLKLGARAMRNGKNAEAQTYFRQVRQILNRVLKDVPQYGDALFTFGELGHAEGNLAETLDYLRRVPATDALYGRAMKYRSQINMQLGRTLEAKADLRKLLGSEPRDLEARVLLIRLLARDRDFAGAETIAKEGLQYFPKNAQLIEIIGEIRRQIAPKADTTLQWVEEYTKAAPLRPSAWALWAKVKIGRDEGEQALTKLRALAKEHPELPVFEVLVADMLRLMQKFDEALDAYKRLSQKHPNDSLLLQTCVDTLMMKGRRQGGGKVPKAVTDEAIRLLNGAIDLARGLDDKRDRERQLPGLLVKLSDIHAEVGELTKTLSILKDAVTEYPRNSQLLLRYGQRLLDAKRHAEALTQFERVVALDPQQSIAWNNMAWTRATMAGGDLNAAWTEVSRALNLSPNQPDYLDTAGWVRFRLNDAQGAIEHLERSLRQAKAPGTQYRLGRAWRLRSTQATRPADKISALEAAQGLLEEALAKWPGSRYAAETREALNGVKSDLQRLKTTP